MRAASLPCGALGLQRQLNYFPAHVHGKAFFSQPILQFGYVAFQISYEDESHLAQDKDQRGNLSAAVAAMFVSFRDFRGKSSWNRHTFEDRLPSLYKLPTFWEVIPSPHAGALLLTEFTDLQYPISHFREGPQFAHCNSARRGVGPINRTCPGKALTETSAKKSGIAVAIVSASGQTGTGARRYRFQSMEGSTRSGGL